MKKEEVLELVKDVVSELAEKGSEFYSDPEAYQAWQIKSDTLDKAVKGLNSCDMDWLSAEYEKWFKENMQEVVEKHRNLLKDFSEWV